MLFDRNKLIADLKRDEGVRLHAYKCTAGKTTIGVGRNIDDVGITEEESDYLLDNDIHRVALELDRALPWWTDLNEPRQRALLNMTFNLGISGLLKFKNMIAALHEFRWDDAAEAALDSLWAKQVGARASRIANTFRTGV